MWEIGLNKPYEMSSRLWTLLSSDEQERAARFRFPDLRQRWTIARGAMRAILAMYTGSHPEALLFENGPYGKPELGALCKSAPLRFNLTHSKDLALLAVAPNDVGIDIEYVNVDFVWESIATHVFSDRERNELIRWQTEYQLRMFFELWTRKEAYMKGRGLGLSLPLTAFSVPVNDADNIGNVDVEPNWNDGRPWHLIRLPIQENTHAATLAYSEPISSLRRFVWSVAPAVLLNELVRHCHTWSPLGC